MARTAKSLKIQENGIDVIEAVVIDFHGADVSDEGQGIAEVDTSGYMIGVNTHKITVSPTPPTSPAVNDLWVNTAP